MSIIVNAAGVIFDSSDATFTGSLSINKKKLREEIDLLTWAFLPESANHRLPARLRGRL